MSAPFEFTEEVIREVVATCQLAVPAEACGFIIARPGSTVGTRMVQITNVSTQIDRYIMDSQQVVNLYAALDTSGEEPVGVFHSHPTSPPIPSALDIEAMLLDVSLAHVIVSLQGGPGARTYRIETPYVGVSEPVQVAMRSVPDADQFADLPTRQWALTPGNVVRIGYLRHGRHEQSYVTGTILPSLIEDMIGIQPTRSTDRRDIEITRIRSVRVQHESAEALALRSITLLALRRMIVSLESGAPSDLPLLLARLEKAFPADVTIERTP